MFNRYWREYPGWMQFLQFVILLTVSASFFLFAGSQVIAKIAGTDTASIVGIAIGSPVKLINAFLILQLVSTIGTFLFPAVTFAYFAHPRPAQYLGAVKPRKIYQPILAIMIMLGALPLLATLAEWISHFDLGASAKAAQEDNDRVMDALLNIPSASRLVFTFIVLAFLPGLCEEFFFRGIVMRFTAKRAPFVFYPILASATVFALMHGNVNGMLSIFIGGIILGYIYYFTGSIWNSVLAHMFYNGVQVYFSYLATTDASIKAFAEKNVVPVEYNIAGAAILIVSFFLLWKTRTPLAPGWAADFSEEDIKDIITGNED